MGCDTWDMPLHTSWLLKYICCDSLANMTFLVALLVATLTIASCEVTQMLELAPAIYAPSAGVRDAKCDECKEALTFVLDHNKTIINFVCGSMPIIAGVCESLVEDLIKNVTAAKICVDLHLCDKSNLAPLSVPSGGLCVECEQTARFLSSNTESIQNYLSAICKKINSESVCDLFVNHFVDILRNSNPTEMCQESRLCKEPAQLILGADLCTQGPSYWCASLDNAKECGAFDFCNEKYWV